MVHIGPSSQTNVLKEQAQRAGVRHDETRRVTIEGLEVAEGQRGPVGYFCFSTSLFGAVVKPGDRRPFPMDAPVEFDVAIGEGRYTIKNALIHANGTIRIFADKETEVVPA